MSQWQAQQEYEKKYANQVAKNVSTASGAPASKTVIGPDVYSPWFETPTNYADLYSLSTPKKKKPDDPYAGLSEFYGY
jgi:hypothetical protein